MKILYIAGNPDGASTLQVEKEINALQEKLDQVPTVSPIDFRVYSHLRIDVLPDVIARIAPDILHFAAHGQDDAIVLAQGETDHVTLDGDMLAALLGALNVRPKLVVLNACGSNNMAAKLRGHADFVIGTDAPLSNIGARSMAATLYGRLAGAASISGAFEAAAVMLNAVDRGTVKACLHTRMDAATVARTRLVDPMRVLACFPQIDKWLAYNHTEPQPGFNPDAPKVMFGLAGVPPTTRQVQFFTDDESVTASQKQSLADARGWMLETQPIHGEIWIEPCYTYYGDMWWYGSVVTGDRKIYSATSTTVAALRQYYIEEAWRGNLPPAIAKLVLEAIGNLERNDGSRRSRSALQKMDTKGP